MEVLHKGFSKLQAKQECKPVNVVKNNKVVVNQLRHVKIISEEQQKLFMVPNRWESPSVNVPIKSFADFCDIRRKLDVYYDSKQGEETLYLMNLFKKVTHTFKNKTRKTVSDNF